MLAEFIFDDSNLKRLNEVLQQYEGTHNFHNFTPKMSGNDKTALRYILSFKSPGKFTINVSTLNLPCRAYNAYNSLKLSLHICVCLACITEWSLNSNLRTLISESANQ